MKRHPFDLTSLLFGLIFGGAAGAYLAAGQLDWEVDGRWVLPAALIALGVASIAGALAGLRSSAQSAEVAPESPSDELQPAGSDRSES
jgi:uncharacterized membrane protein YfcA